MVNQKAGNIWTQMRVSSWWKPQSYMHTPGPNKHLKNLAEHNRCTNRKNEIQAADPDRSFEEQSFFTLSGTLFCNLFFNKLNAELRLKWENWRYFVNIAVKVKFSWTLHSATYRSFLVRAEQCSIKRQFLATNISTQVAWRRRFKLNEDLRNLRSRRKWFGLTVRFLLPTFFFSLETRCLRDTMRWKCFIHGRSPEPGVSVNATRDGS